MTITHHPGARTRWLRSQQERSTPSCAASSWPPMSRCDRIAAAMVAAFEQLGGTLVEQAVPAAQACRFAGRGIGATGRCHAVGAHDAPGHRICPRRSCAPRGRAMALDRLPASTSRRKRSRFLGIARARVLPAEGRAGIFAAASRPFRGRVGSRVLQGARSGPGLQISAATVPAISTRPTAPSTTRRLSRRETSASALSPCRAISPELRGWLGKLLQPFVRL